ncbi:MULTISPECIES: hypothetical protein [unclassified Enterococcus]|uniref:hypothetical protein n=1 Tax=unclassified Enterococcus TaxID=2608891 RepID=UPI001554933B|nr:MULTISPECIES: hypothetical protein [unclassified Enterococcus]MBS7578446.1 hypothetical protein [Enterococcus sp. MMGLQ5-2]MBS7585689.1 hypothetical protein [Enterococcus sp. MMGLQ5-1]NPD13548.1 hypothetical protein [Enterococcus sp. MMGLQ5-1]NPD38278.1 hypothetical protein [Enterococcus sp. MMGLQ5-2]
MDIINYDDTKKIEFALGFELRYFQIRYLLGETQLNSDYRNQGNSTIFAVKELLTKKGRYDYDLDSSDLSLFIDYRGNSTIMRRIMRPMIKEINRKLVEAGFHTCAK